MARLSANIDQQIDEAIADARDPYDAEVALSAEYDICNDLLFVVLKSGHRLSIAREDLQGLADADPVKVGKVELASFGTALHWEELDMDFGVDGLQQGRYGSERWMKQLRQGDLVPHEQEM